MGHEEQKLNEAEAIGFLLADAFIARMERFPAPQRERLLFACHQRLLERDPATAKTLFEGEKHDAATVKRAAKGHES